ncbi:hypothetical protein E2C01_070608 [Portunus trituberculatus]|uniref:Uncharacterized protein n=1 Tax=Portunus trituberculatus TaxID=210409 RepID=A0A5B7HT58_PORTR|nr:hypothetical protein [Portunus trituberculatus]
MHNICILSQVCFRDLPTLHLLYDVLVAMFSENYDEMLEKTAKKRLARQKLEAAMSNITTNNITSEETAVKEINEATETRLSLSRVQSEKSTNTCVIEETLCFMATKLPSLQINVSLAYIICTSAKVFEKITGQTT